MLLITGANGQLGNELRLLLGDNALYTDYAELDITNAAEVRAFVNAHRVDMIVNCAAYTAVDKAESDEEKAYAINAVGPANLAQAGVPLIHVSTDYVFDGASCRPYVEDDVPNPATVYGRTKLAGEKHVLENADTALVIRTAWLYSSFGNNFVKTMRRLTAGRDQLSVVFDQVGTPTYAGDLADLIVYVIKTGKYKDYRGIYHFSNEGVCSWYDFAKEIAALSGNICDIRPCHSDEFPSKVKRPAFSVLDKTKIKKDFDYVIPYWRDSLVKCNHELDKI